MPQKQDGQWTRAKGFDSFAPVGPWIATGLSPAGLAVECRVERDGIDHGRQNLSISARSAAGVHTPLGPRKSGMPLAVDTPAPVKTRMRRAARRCVTSCGSITPRLSHRDMPCQSADK